MRKSILLIALLGAGFVTPGMALAEEAAAAPAAAEPASPHAFAYNVGLYSQYIFRGLTQTGEEPAIQGGVDYSHASGFYAGAWASNISWLEDAGLYDNSSLEIDIYGGYRNAIGETGIAYDVGLLQYLYPGSKNSGVKSAETTEIYGSLGYKWVSGKLSVVVSDGAFGLDDADGSWYAELNGNIPLAETGFTVNLHAGRQEFEGSGNSDGDYTDWKVGLTKSWSNGVNVGGFYTDTNAKDSFYTIENENIGDEQFTVFVQKTF